MSGDDKWDYDNGVLHPPVPPDKRRAVVSVAMPTADFEIVARAARASDMKVSEFIRKAAVAKAKGEQPRLADAHITTSLGGLLRYPITKVTTPVRFWITRRTP